MAEAGGGSRSASSVLEALVGRTGGAAVMRDGARDQRSRCRGIKWSLLVDPSIHAAQKRLLVPCARATQLLESG